MRILRVTAWMIHSKVRLFNRLWLALARWLYGIEEQGRIDRLLDGRLHKEWLENAL